MRRPLQPSVEIEFGHPASPADFQPLVYIELVGAEQRGRRTDAAEIQKLGDEGIPAALLQRIVECAVLMVEQDHNGHQTKLGGDDGKEQKAARPAILRPEIWDRKLPNST